MSGKPEEHSDESHMLRAHIEAFLKHVDLLRDELELVSIDEAADSVDSRVDSRDGFGESGITSDGSGGAAVLIGSQDASPLFHPSVYQRCKEQFTQRSGPEDWGESSSEGVPAPLRDSILLRFLLYLPTLTQRGSTTDSPGGRTYMSYLGLVEEDTQLKEITIIKESDREKIEQHKNGKVFKFSAPELSTTVTIHATVDGKKYEFSYQPDMAVPRLLEDVATGDTPELTSPRSRVRRRHSKDKKHHDSDGVSPRK